MNLYKPSELQEFLKKHNLLPKKGLSQNFLIDGNIIQKIIDLAELQEGELVIEIGPGPGALTEALLKRGAQVIAIEKDRKLAQELSRLQTPDNRLQVVSEDALTLSFPDLLKGRSAKVIANLPYQITTPILTTLLPLYPPLTSLTLMVQKEFAERLMGKPHTPEYSSITLFSEFYGKITKHFVVSPGCFYPKPKVHSMVVHYKTHAAKLPGEEEPFFTLTRTAFGKRRKMLKSSLKELYPLEKIEEGLISLNIPMTARPEELSLGQFIALYRFLCPK